MSADCIAFVRVNTFSVYNIVPGQYVVKERRVGIIMTIWIGVLTLKDACLSYEKPCIQI